MFIKSKYRIGGSPDFESAGLLKILTFEKYLHSTHSIQRATRENGRPMDVRFNSQRSFSDVLYRRFIHDQTSGSIAEFLVFNPTFLKKGLMRP